MATIINNPTDTRPVVEDSGVGVVVGLIVAVILVVLFFMFAWPAIQNNGAGTYTPADTSEPAGASANINLTVPASPSGATGGASGGTSQ